MMRSSARCATRGFTVIELIIAMFVMAIVMSIAALEFESVIYQHMFTESHLTAEQQARVAMAKLSGAARQMSVDITDVQPGASPNPPVLQPISTPGPVLQYTQVAGLTPDVLPTPNGVPRPCYNIVTISLVVPPGKPAGQLQEAIEPAATTCIGYTYPSSPLVLSRNVRSFDVQPVSGVLADYGTGYRVDLVIFDLEDNAVDQRMGASYALSTVVTPIVFGKAQ